MHGRHVPVILRSSARGGRAEPAPCARRRPRLGAEVFVRGAAAPGDVADVRCRCSGATTPRGNRHWRARRHQTRHQRHVDTILSRWGLAPKSESREVDVNTTTRTGARSGRLTHHRPRARGGRAANRSSARATHLELIRSADERWERASAADDSHGGDGGPTWPHAGCAIAASSAVVLVVIVVFGSEVDSVRPPWIRERFDDGVSVAVIDDRDTGARSPFEGSEGEAPVW